MKRLGLLEISDDKSFREWAKALMTDRYDEAVESLKVEEVSEESVFYLEIESKKYLAFYMEGECKPADQNVPINREHREILKQIVKGKIKTELLYSVENPHD